MERVMYTLQGSSFSNFCWDVSSQTSKELVLNSPDSCKSCSTALSRIHSVVNFSRQGNSICSCTLSVFGTCNYRSFVHFPPTEIQSVHHSLIWRTLKHWIWRIDSPVTQSHSDSPPPRPWTTPICALIETRKSRSLPQWIHLPLDDASPADRDNSVDLSLLWVVLGIRKKKCGSSTGEASSSRSAGEASSRAAGRNANPHMADEEVHTKLFSLYQGAWHASGKTLAPRRLAQAMIIDLQTVHPPSCIHEL